MPIFANRRRSLSQLPKSFSHNSLDRGAAKLGRAAAAQQARTAAASAALIRRTPSMELGQSAAAIPPAFVIAANGERSSFR